MLQEIKEKYQNNQENEELKEYVRELETNIDELQKQI